MLAMRRENNQIFNNAPNNSNNSGDDGNGIGGTNDITHDCNDYQSGMFENNISSIFIHIISKCMSGVFRWYSNPSTTSWTKRYIRSFSSSIYSNMHLRLDLPFCFSNVHSQISHFRMFAHKIPSPSEKNENSPRLYCVRPNIIVYLHSHNAQHGFKRLHTMTLT